MGQIIHFNEDFLGQVNVFIETGYGAGVSAEVLSTIIERGYSIELSDELYNNGIKRGNPRVTMVHGDSSIELANVIKEVNEDCLFWLDAHYYAAHGFKGEGTNLPLIKELEILAERKFDDIILVDDIRIYIKDIVYQSGALPAGYENCYIDLEGLVKVMFPKHTVIVEPWDEGYMAIIPKKYLAKYANN